MVYITRFPITEKSKKNSFSMSEKKKDGTFVSIKIPMYVAHFIVTEYPSKLIKGDETFEACDTQSTWVVDLGAEHFGISELPF